MYYIILYFFYYRARSVFERALDVDHRTVTVWLKYAEMEMKSVIIITCWN